MVEGKHRYLREVDSLLLEGAPPGSVDRVIEDHQSCGMTMGPCRMPDPAGVDIASHVLLERERQGTLPAAPAYRAVLRWLHAEERLGQKFGLGYCRYDRRKPVDDEAALRVFKTLAAELGVSRRGITKQEIVEQLLYPMVNEGIRDSPRRTNLQGRRIDQRHIAEWLQAYGRLIVDQLGYWGLSPLLPRHAANGRRMTIWRAGA